MYETVLNNALCILQQSMRSTMSGISSSSGSYSLGGSNPNVTEDLDDKDKTPTGKPKEVTLEKPEPKETKSPSPGKDVKQLVPKMIVRPIMNRK